MPLEFVYGKTLVYMQILAITWRICLRTVKRYIFILTVFLQKIPLSWRNCFIKIVLPHQKLCGDFDIWKSFSEFQWRNRLRKVIEKFTKTESLYIHHGRGKSPVFVKITEVVARMAEEKSTSNFLGSAALLFIRLNSYENFEILYFQNFAFSAIVTNWLLCIWLKFSLDFFAHCEVDMY